MQPILRRLDSVGWKSTAVASMRCKLPFHPQCSMIHMDRVGDQVGAQAWSSHCYDKHVRGQKKLECLPLRPVVLKDAHVKQTAHVNIPHDLEGFSAKYTTNNGLSECVPNQQQCNIDGCLSFSLLHFLYFMIKGSTPCKYVEVSE